MVTILCAEVHKNIFCVFTSNIFWVGEMRDSFSASAPTGKGRLLFPNYSYYWARIVMMLSVPNITQAPLDYGVHKEICLQNQELNSVKHILVLLPSTLSFYYLSGKI